MKPWDLEELRMLVTQKHGENQVDTLRRYLIAFDWKLKTAVYHQQLATAPLQESLKTLTVLAK